MTSGSKVLPLLRCFPLRSSGDWPLTRSDVKHTIECKLQYTLRHTCILWICFITKYLYVSFFRKDGFSCLLLRLCMGECSISPIRYKSFSFVQSHPNTTHGLGWPTCCLTGLHTAAARKHSLCFSVTVIPVIL